MTPGNPPRLGARRISLRGMDLRRARWRVIVLLLPLVILAVALIDPHLVTGIDPLHTDPRATLRAPSAAHLFGTDRLGRDVFSRVVHGTRYSVGIGLAATTLCVLAGVLWGLLSALAPAWLDEVSNRFLDAIGAFPGVLLCLVLITFTGTGSANLVVALAIAGTPRLARLVRSNARGALSMHHTTQAIIMGLTRRHVIGVHVLPRALAGVPHLAALEVGAAILTASGLSFIGLGVQPPTPEWGAMMSEGRLVLRIAWWPSVFPGIATVAVVLLCALIGHGLSTAAPSATSETRNRS
ncbi:ABC transporter permease subunit [Nocardia sp. SYP-A9097]|uniref:ABC transporter permease n=1 Tax=Nocardia sp. SYP-A9097 TaxID=2663237 RepID=UPI00129AF888|nr:ABC transporter permease [Nocardia sp. SYP-A9097]MRH89625.1 ABC transporter permease subunit [Nocardia sp. SYP-A9097]